MNQEEFFREFELDVEMLPHGIEELGVKVHLPNAKKVCWDFIIYNKIKIEEIIKISDGFDFVGENNFKFILNRKLKQEKKNEQED